MPDYHISSNKIHAALVLINGFGVLLIGKSGLGKSDLALRLIENKQAQLVADDVVVLEKENGILFGRPIDEISGLLEVRGIGLVHYPHVAKAEINLCACLTETMEEIERFPYLRKENILGVEIPQIDLYAKESSAAEKVCVAVRLFCRKI